MSATFWGTSRKSGAIIGFLRDNMAPFTLIYRDPETVPFGITVSPDRAE